MLSDMQRFVGKNDSSPLSSKLRTYCSGPVYLPRVTSASAGPPVYYTPSAVPPALPSGDVQCSE